MGAATFPALTTESPSCGIFRILMAACLSSYSFESILHKYPCRKRIYGIVPVFTADTDSHTHTFPLRVDSRENKKRVTNRRRIWQNNFR